MSNAKIAAKIAKAAAKKKSEPITKLLNKCDAEDLILALNALANIGDENSSNFMVHFLDHEDKNVRLTACKACLSVNTEYMKTRVRHQLAMEKDAETKTLIQQAFNAVNL